ncbi:protein-disulfide reductase DsbD domain-containing protein [Jiella pelagia]|uniref:Protein-disulfide reductase DsbD family protein n=1 Tax=Jiella pelagia TaxID=2986949 RepID=A0ABY7C6N5_9HYPH|nr:protein-disulfide reductase DsbD domain-containing protein [Jiella pelagia]WAP71010.1 protein-disulfide reductase DsbD family protein [Jiella pelagia]
MHIYDPAMRRAPAANLPHIAPWVRRAVAGLAVLLCCGLAPVLAADNDASVFRNNEVTLRLVRAKEPVDGAVRAALLVDLAPGWKTYWIDPGASGVPPLIDLSRTAGFQTIDQHFPPPHRFGEDMTRANGYEGDVAFAFELAVEPGETIETVAASLFLGVCKDICIPVQADLAAGTQATDDEAVASAFAALPTEAADGAFEVSGAADGKSLRVAVIDDADGAGAPDLFVTSAGGWYFDEPSRVSREGGHIVYDVPIAERPSGVDGRPEAVDLLFTREGKGLSATSVRVSPAG